MQKPNPGGPGAPAAHKLKTGDDLSEVVMLTDNAQMPTNVTVGPNGVIGRTGATGYLLTRLDGLLDTTWGKIKPILLGSPLADLPAPLGTFRQVLHMRLGVTDSMERLSHPAYYQDLLLPAVGNLIEMAPALTEDAPLAMEGIDVAKLSATSGTLAQVRKIRVPLEQIVNGLRPWRRTWSRGCSRRSRWCTSGPSRCSRPTPGSAATCRRCSGCSMSGSRRCWRAGATTPGWRRTRGQARSRRARGPGPGRSRGPGRLLGEALLLAAARGPGPWGFR